MGRRLSYSQDVIAGGRLGRSCMSSRNSIASSLGARAWREQARTRQRLWVDLGSHLIDQSLQLFGLPAALSADLVTQRDGAVTNDGFHAQLRYADGLRWC